MTTRHLIQTTNHNEDNEPCSAGALRKEPSGRAKLTYDLDTGTGWLNGDTHAEDALLSSVLCQPAGLDTNDGLSHSWTLMKCCEYETS